MATIILFDCYKMQLKIGCLRWAKMRVLKAMAHSNSVSIALDKSFVKEEVENCGLPQAPAEDAGGPLLPLPPIPAEDLLAADGFQMVAFEECAANLGAEWDGKDGDPSELPTLHEVPEQEINERLGCGTEEDFFDTSLSTKVTFQEEGNTLVLLDPAFDEPVTAKSLQYIHSTAYKVVAKKGLASTPPIEGCSLMYNKFFGHDSVFIYCLHNFKNVHCIMQHIVYFILLILSIRV